MNLLKEENVAIYPGADDWKDAVIKSTLLLEEHGYVEERYKNEIIGNLEKFGPYILIAENIALPHARPEQGAIESQIAVTLFREPVTFPNGEDARLFVTLAASDANSHLDVLMEISERLSDEEQVEQMLAAPNTEALYQFFN